MPPKIDATQENFAGTWNNSKYNTLKEQNPLLYNLSRRSPLRKKQN
jgi:hypothetical protein